MAEVQRSSFIPRQAAGSVPSRVRRKRRFHVFGFIATAFLLASVILAVGLMFYKDYVAATLESEKKALEEERKRFNEGNIASVTELDRRIAAAYYVLDNHIAPSKIFDVLELTTKDRVQFTNFDFTRRPSGDVTLTIEGSTPEFKTVALQALQFGRDPLMKDSVFTQLGTYRPEATILRNIDNQDQLFEQETRVNFSVIGLLDEAQLAFVGESFLEEQEADETKEEGAEEVGVNVTDDTETTEVSDESFGVDAIESATAQGEDVTTVTENGTQDVDGAGSDVEIESGSSVLRVDETTGNDI